MARPDWWCLKCVFHDLRGAATSLLEATATIAVGATLAAAAVGIVGDMVNEAKVGAARVDVQAIAQAINKFYKDNNFFPHFWTPITNPSSPSVKMVDVLKSKFGDDAAVPTTPVKDEGAWTSATSAVGFTTVTRFDFLENQLITNTPGEGTPGEGLAFFGFGGGRYILRGESTIAPTQGWEGPYLANPPASDPWGNKYYVNVKFLQPLELENRRTVIVISAGPNETIQTPFTLAPGSVSTSGSSTGKIDRIQLAGDDIGERLR